MDMGVRARTNGRAALPDTLFRVAADQAPHVVWIINAKGAVTYLNRAWYELVGGMPPKWQGHEWMDVVAPEDVAVMREQWKAVGATGAVFEGTRRVRACDGTWHVLSYKATPVFDERGLLCWVGMDSDITELMDTQAALQTANRELEAFAAAVSHDLRGPLLTLQGFTQVLSEELGASASPKALQYLGRVGIALKNMNALVEGLLALSRATGSKLKLEDVDLSAIADQLLVDLQSREPARRVEVSVEPRIRVFADVRLMTAMLLNLLGNAWKFTSAMDGARISLSLVTQTAEETVFSIADNGPGFDMEAARNLFSPFERLHGSQFPGTGIGLATVRRIVNRHGGRVWVDAAPQRGATFSIALPAKGKLAPESGSS